MVQEGFVQNFTQTIHPSSITLLGMSEQQLVALLQSANPPNLVIALYDPTTGVVHQGTNILSQPQS